MRLKKLFSVMLAAAIAVTGGSDVFVGTKTVNAAQTVIETESNDSFATANQVKIIEAGTTEISGVFQYAKEQYYDAPTEDYYKVVLKNPGKMKATIVDIDAPDVKAIDFILYSEKFNELKNDLGQIEYMHGGNVTCYIKVKPQTGASKNHNYKITITEDESKLYEQDNDIDVQYVNELKADTTITGRCQLYSDQDTYKIIVPKGYYGVVNFGMDSEGQIESIVSGWKVRVMSGGNTIAFNDEVKTKKNLNNNQTNTERFYPGKYSICVSRKAVGNVQPYNISLKLFKNVAPKLSGVQSKKKIVLVKWKKDKKATGYQIQYSLKKNFKKAKKFEVLKNRTSAKIKRKNFKSKKTYYIRVRSVVAYDAYKDYVNHVEFPAGKFYSNWSNVKKVKVK